MADLTNAAHLTPTARITARILEHCRSLGFEQAGIVRLEPSQHAAFYHDWLAAGHHGSMDYLAREDAVHARLQPSARWQDAKSAIVVGLNYYTGEGASGGDAGSGVIARYARGRDYHKVIGKKLRALLGWLEREVGHALPAARAYVDTGPVLERELARRAGFGWFGRSSMLINPKRGSYFFLGSLLVELELDADEPFVEDRCGTCNACVSACPTGALLGRDANGAPVIDARRCISYLTIEHRGPIPRELRPLMGNRIFGCDICQEVCPWNGPRFVSLTREPAFAARGPGTPPHGVEKVPSDGWHPGTAFPPLIELMSMDEAAWESFSRGSALRRAGRAGFLRNVAVALGNWGSMAAVPVLVSALEDDEPLVRGHSAWALGRIESDAARAALRCRLERESDASVRRELELSLGSDLIFVDRGFAVETIPINGSARG